jgi:DNA processing protein
MIAEHTLHWLLLQRLPGFTSAAIRKLARGIDDPAVCLHYSASRLRASGLSDQQLDSVLAWQRSGDAHPAWLEARRDAEWLAAHEVRLVAFTEPRYPPLLLEISDPPPLLYVAGVFDCLDAPQLAVVGSRHPSPDGLRAATQFAGDLATAGFVVTSGLAYGIDAAAHAAALAVGGRTVAVLGCGIDIVYPPEHGELAASIRAGGALVSEFPLRTSPRGPQFPSRNRIISGLSLGVLVVEAALRSGSLITARLALEQNREVFAIPGALRNPASVGTNRLIRNGATLVQAAGDIVDELHGWANCPPLRPPAPLIAAPAPPAPPPLDLPPEAAAVLAAVDIQPTPLDLLLESLEQPLPAVLATLGELELRGLVENVAGAYRRIEGRKSYS